MVFYFILMFYTKMQNSDMIFCYLQENAIKFHLKFVHFISRSRITHLTTVKVK